MHEHRNDFGVLACDASFSVVSFYKHHGHSAPTLLGEHQQRRADLEVKILAIHQEPKGVYGASKVTAELHDRGEVITAKTVAKIMRSLGIVEIPHKHFARGGTPARGRSRSALPSSTRLLPFRRTWCDASSIRADSMWCGPPTLPI